MGWNGVDNERRWSLRLKITSRNVPSCQFTVLPCAMLALFPKRETRVVSMKLSGVVRDWYVEGPATAYEYGQLYA